MADLNQLKAAVSRALETATGYGNSTLSQDRARALDYYYQRPVDKLSVVEGQSSVITSDVADTIEWTLPSLMRIFAGGQDICRFEPMGPEDEQSAKQAGEYVNYVFTQDNHGFMILYTWFKDALLQRNGVVEVVWDQSIDVNPETYIGLSEPEFAYVVNDPDVQIVGHSQQPDPDAGPMEVAPGVVIIPMVHDVQLIRRKDQSRCRVLNIPPEEFVISREAVRIEDAILVGRAFKRTVSDLVDEGFPRELIERLPSSPASSFIRQQDERIARETNARGDTSPIWSTPMTGATREVDYFRGYIRFDLDDDGIAELIMVEMAGGEILRHEPTDVAPFASLTPVPMPHTWVGRSLADQSMQSQLVSSTVLRQMLFNMYAANNARTWALEGQVNMDDLLTPRPAGVVRVKSPNAVGVLPVVPMIADALTTLEYVQSMREVQTGVTRYSQGTDANTLNKTATGVNLIQNAGAQRIELIARVFAETGVKQVMKLILRCVSKYQQRKRMIRLRNQWVPMDPRMWANGMDATIQVGIGTGNREAVAAGVLSILGLQEKIIMLQGGAKGPVVTLQHVHAALGRYTEALGFKSEEQFFGDPATTPMPPPEPPQPDPNEVLKAQVSMEQIASNERIATMRESINAKKVDAEIGKQAGELFIEGQKVALERGKADIEGVVKVAQVENDRERNEIEADKAKAKAKEPAGA